MKITIHTMALAMCAMILPLAPKANACGHPVSKGLAARLIAPPAIAHGANPEGNASNSIVGLWHTTFLLGSGPGVYDEAYEQWHSDGTELAIDNAVPPILGNVCVGVFKQTGPRTYKLRHVTWNWDVAGNKAGTFLLIMTVTVDPQGGTFTGSYVTDSYDTFGAVIPELHAEGVVNGSRITVD